MAYEGQCGSCGYFEMNDGNPSLKGHCSWYKTYYYPNETCGHYRKKGSASGGCYLTTILCHRLGKSDDCDELNTLRKFRNEVLQKDEKYQELLFEYDTVGPKIAKELEKEDITIVQGLFSKFVQPVVRFIKENKCEEAISRYRTMTKSLEDYYCLSLDTCITKDYDYSKGGHGKVLVKVKSMGRN